MTFTEFDAENDGLIKREVGREMNKVAQAQNPEMYEHFLRVCEEIGREPDDIFGEMAVRALNNESFAEQVFNSEVSMKQLQADEIRVEDVQYVKKLSDELGLNETQDSSDPIQKLIDQRLESITQSPIPRLREQEGQGGGGDGEVMEYMESLHSKIERLESRVADGEAPPETDSQGSQESEQSIDDLFGDSDGGSEETVEEPEEPEEPPEPGDAQGMTESPDFDDIVEGEPEPEDEGGDEGGVEEEPEGFAEQEPEELEMGVDIPSDGADEDEAVLSSEDGEEE